MEELKNLTLSQRNPLVKKRMSLKNNLRVSSRKEIYPKWITLKNKKLQKSQKIQKKKKR